MPTFSRRKAVHTGANLCSGSSKLNSEEHQQFEQEYQQEEQLMSGFNAAVMEQVRKEAIDMGQKNTLKLLIKHRFDELPSDYLDKIDQANEQQLETWLVNFVDAQAIEQVFQ